MDCFNLFDQENPDQRDRTSELAARGSLFARHCAVCVCGPAMRGGSRVEGACGVMCTPRGYLLNVGT